MIKFLKIIWQLPQYIVGLIYFWYLYRNNKLLTVLKEKDWTVYYKTSCGSVTLGSFIFATSVATEKTIKHESGHTKQSLILGPLYLLVIGIPSILWAWSHRWIAPNKPYNWFYTENLADKLGGVSQ